MHDSFTPLGGMVPLINLMLSEVIFGGVGAGMYGMLVFVILRLYCGIDGGADAGIFGEEDRSLRRKDGDAGDTDFSAGHFSVHGDFSSV